MTAGAPPPTPALEAALVARPRLFYGDYGIETPTEKANAVYRFLKEQLADGTPIDGIGLQAHMTCDCVGQPGCNNATVIAGNMARFAELGLAIWVTELDVAMAPGCTQQMQADVYAAVLEACLVPASHCDAFMVWGFTDRYTWLDNVTKAPTMLDAQFNPKPAFFSLQKVMQDHLDKRGAAHLRPAFGRRMPV